MEVSTVELERIWAVLTAPVQSELNAYPRRGVRGRATQIAIDRRGRRALLIPHDEETIDVPSDMPLLAVTDGEYAFTSERGRYLGVRCEDGRFEHEFTMLCADVASATEESPEPARAALRVLERWRRLLATLRSRSLTMPQRLGLFAELTVLSALLDGVPPPGFDCWRGPLGEPHDFRLRSDAIEVKAVGTGTKSVEVHGLDQLDRGGAARLHLLVATAVESSDGRTIHSLVDEVRDAIGDHDALDSRLRRVGWTRGDAEQRFLVVEWRAGRVDEHFPRLVPSDLVDGSLRAGVVGLSYDIDIDIVREMTRQVEMPTYLREVES